MRVSEDLLLRRACSSDAEDVADMFLAARAENLPHVHPAHTDAETRAYFDGVMANPRYLSWVAEQDGRPIGFLVLRDGWVDHLYVRPGYYRRGIGSRLLERAKRTSPAGLRLFCFQCNAGARKFYERRGLVMVHSSDGSDNEEGEPDLEFYWNGEI